MRVAVCTITCRRPDGLRRLLDSLNALTFRDDPPELEIVVVDNDADRSAAAVCESFRPRSKWPVLYEIEPRRGIPFARNKAVSLVVDRAELIAFIDDDEEAEPNWLDELLRVQRQTEADIVTGPVEAHFAEPVPAWITRGRLFGSRHHTTGDRLDVAYTHNVLVASEVYRTMPMCFDEDFAMTGGSDSEFFRRAHRAGHGIVWAESALVREWIPRSRACASWLVRRSYRTGITMTVIAMKRAPGWRMRLLSVSKAAVWFVVGITTCMLGLVAGRAMMVRGLGFMAYGIGTLVSLFGIRFEEYRTVHGS